MRTMARARVEVIEVHIFPLEQFDDETDISSNMLFVASKGKVLLQTIH